MACREWYVLDYLIMVAKLRFVDSKDGDSVPEVTWSNFCTLDFHHGSVPGETRSNHCVEHNFSDELSHTRRREGSTELDRETLHQARRRPNSAELF